MPTLHFLLSDIEGSTRLWEAHPEAMKGALAMHDDQIRKAIETNDGVLFKHTGDGVAAVFGSAADALAAAAAAQRGFARTTHPDIGELRVRMGVHSGSAEERDGDYFGPPLNRASRLMAAAHGGQVLASLVTERLAATNLPEGLSLRSLGEHRLKDLARPEQVFQLLISGLSSDFPAIRTPDVVPNNLPVLGTTFVGRNQEVAEVEKLVRGARLVTVTGVGGAGKTRLALQVAAGLVEEFAHGVWFVELAAVTDPDLVAAQTADALAVVEHPGEPILETLLDHVASKSMLLVIDNCEHVIVAAADLSEALLQQSPDSRILATSRELLGIGGEVAYGTRSMALPRDVSDLGPIDLARYDAVQLFLERAAAAKPDFFITAENAPAVAEICRRLDGMPLGIELAAARLRSFTPQQIAEHLDQRFRILTGGARTALPRQQTLAAAIDWSYRLLDEREHLLFERLSVFQGGFDLQAAQTVCSGDGLDEFDVFELVPVLVDKSLVNANVGGEAARYRLLETIRQFARDRLDEAGATDSIRRRHAEFYMGLAEEAEPNVRGEREKEWWDRLDVELDNLRLAMEWSLEAGQPEVGMRLAGAMWRFWWFTVRFTEGVQWLRRMSEAADAVPDVYRGKVLVGLGTLAGFMNDASTAAEMLGQAIELYRGLERAGADPADLRYSYSAALINYAAVYAEPNRDYDLSAELNREALEVSQTLDDQAGVAVALGNLAEDAARRGDVEAARAGFAEGIAASRALNSAQRTVEGMIQYAVFEASVDEHEEAAETLQEAAVLAAEGNLPLWEATCGLLRAQAGQHLGQANARSEFIRHAVAMYSSPEWTTYWWPQLAAAIGRADIEYQVDNLDRAAVLLGVLDRLEDEHGAIEVVFQPRLRQLESDLISSLGETDFAAARARGRTLPEDEASSLISGP